MRAESLASSQSCRSVDADAWCKRALNDKEANSTKSYDCLLLIISISAFQEEIMDTKGLREEHERILKRFFGAGVTPDFAQNAADRTALAGWLKLFCAQFI